MISKNKILKGINQRIKNNEYCIVDIEVEMQEKKLPPDQDWTQELKQRNIRLQEILVELDSLLI